MNRPGIARKVVATICTVLLVLSTSDAVFAQQTSFGQLPSKGWKTASLSQSIIRDANSATERLILDNQNGRLTSSDVEDAATSLQILFDHFQEIGLNDALQKQILGDTDSFLNLHPSQNQVAAYHASLASRGVHVSVAQVQTVMDPGLESRQEFLDTIKKVGLYQAEMEVVTQLRQQASQLGAQTMGAQQSIHLTNHTMHLIRVITPVCGACFILAGIGLASGCTVTVAACGASLGACLTCALGG